MYEKVGLEKISDREKNARVEGKNYKLVEKSDYSEKEKNGKSKAEIKMNMDGNTSRCK